MTTKFNPVAIPMTALTLEVDSSDDFRKLADHIDAALRIALPGQDIYISVSEGIMVKVKNKLTQVDWFKRQLSKPNHEGVTQ